METKTTLDLPDIVDKAIRAIAGQLTDKSAVKGTVGDLLRLLQLRDELGVVKKGKILAGWVSECDQTPIDR